MSLPGLCTWCSWPTSLPSLLIENIPERLCRWCLDLIAACGIANVRL